MEMCYDGALVMPSNYAVMDEEEMTYVEGGGVSIPRAVAKALLKKYAGSIAGKLGWCVTKLSLMAGSDAVNFMAGKVLGLVDTICSCATSIGGIASVVIDCVDRDGMNGKITLF